MTGFKFSKILMVSVLFLFSVLFSSCVSYNQMCMVKGNYTASDYIDGNLKIYRVSVFQGGYSIYFSNYKTLDLITAPGSGLTSQVKETPVSISYRGHTWGKGAILLDEVCSDKNKNAFFIKFTADINVSDCEKSILHFKCDKLLVQFDGPRALPGDMNSSGSCL